MDSTISFFGQLSKSRGNAEYIPEHLGSGAYAMFAKNLDCLPGVTIPPSGVVYIGMSSRLELGDHFTARHIGFSTVCRSLGAILRKELGLFAEPRSKGESRTNYRNFRFKDDGERHLSRWMQLNMEYSVVELEGDLSELETCLISQNEPPLNLTKFENNQKKLVQSLGNKCKEEARRIWEINCLARRRSSD